MNFLPTAVSIVALSGALLAQTPISGDIYDGNGGPLLSGVVYHATGNLHVPVGQTLTIQAGAIVKLSFVPITVSGTLRSQGTLANPVIITSIHDDAAGGDTNGNGSATLPAVSQWYGMHFPAGSDASVLTHTIIRYTGWGGWENVQMSGSSPSFVDCTFSDGGGGGMRLDSTAQPSVIRCTFARIEAEPAAFGASLAAVANFVDNTVSACSGGNFLRTDSNVVTGAVAINPNNCMGGALVYNGNLIVPGGTTLTLGAGVVLKPIAQTTFTVNGTLLANGTAADPVVLTSFHDDAAGGDTNGNGSATLPAVSQWYGMNFTVGSDASVLLHTTVRYTGWGGWENVQMTDSDPSFVDCTFSDGGGGGMRLDAASRPTVTRCAFARIESEPSVFGASLAAVAGFVDNTVSTCPGGGFLRTDSNTVSEPVTIDADNCMGGALVYNGNLIVSGGASLTLGAGVVMKPLAQATFTVNGTLVANGTAANPVVLTSIHDDAAGGDTNGNLNVTTGAASQWFGLRFNAGSNASVLQHTIVRYTGWGGWQIVAVDNADPSFLDCAFTDGGGGGMSLGGSALPTVTRCAFERIDVAPAVFGLNFEEVAAFTDNTVANCSGGSYMRVDRGTLDGTATVLGKNCLGGALVISGNLLVSATGSLSLNPGVVLKTLNPITATVAGQLLSSGPVVFTSIHDDNYGGDTNGNGNATLAAPSQWFGMMINSGATGGLDQTLVRCTGWGGWAGIDCRSTSFSLTRSRTELAATAGFDLSAAATATDLVAFACTNDGLLLRSGGFDLLRATSAYNGGRGISRTSASWTGQVRSSIAFGNGAAGFSGFGAGDVHYSNGPGIPGGNFNLNVDPLFVNAAASDLRLAPNSPCVDKGDPLDAPLGQDPLGFPRLLDGRLSSFQRVDMGAFEFDNCLLLASGNATPGGTITLTTISTPSIFAAVLAMGLPAPFGFPALNFGGLWVDLGGPFDTVTWPANGSVPITIPTALLTPFPFTFQLVGLANPFPRGNTSNPVTITIQ